MYRGTVIVSCLLSVYRKLLINAFADCLYIRPSSDFFANQETYVL